MEMADARFNARAALILAFDPKNRCLT